MNIIDTDSKRQHDYTYACTALQHSIYLVLEGLENGGLADFYHMYMAGLREGSFQSKMVPCLKLCVSDF